jgi:hypothetical protein
MSELENKIQKYYGDFKRDFNKKNFPGVFQLIEEHNSKKNKSYHDLGNFAILYTPVRYKPKIMMIGNNPSWFDKDNPENGYKIVRELMKAPAKECSYLVHNHVYARRLQDAFSRVGRMDLLANCVGMNRLWLQTGPENASWNRACKTISLELRQNLYEYCQTRTKEIINLIKPKVVLLVGAKAQGLLQGQAISNTVVKSVAYPLGGGITLLENELREIIKDEKL